MTTQTTQKPITIGGSELAALLLLNKYVSLEDLFNDKVGTVVAEAPKQHCLSQTKASKVTFVTPCQFAAAKKENPPAVYTGDAMLHGIIFEPVVVEIIEGLFGAKMYSKQKKLTRDGLVYLPDGMIYIDDIPHLVEIKAPRSRKLIRGTTPCEYIPQLELGTYMAKVDRSMYFEAAFRHVPLGEFISQLSAKCGKVSLPPVLSGIIIAFVKPKSGASSPPKVNLRDLCGGDENAKKCPKTVWDAYGRLSALVTRGDNGAKVPPGPKRTFHIFDGTKPVMPQFIDAVCGAQSKSTTEVMQILAWELTDANCVIRKHTGNYIDKALPFVHRFIKLATDVRQSLAANSDTSPRLASTGDAEESTLPVPTEAGIDAKKEIARLREDISKAVFDASATVRLTM